ncbi:olfactory receptor 6N1-like [Cololabis saira]|uniref:olfactory receptor 6N1-like n=1 Tax=Cololabis saira TaxID=129043 RepID=UPI002AD262A5|nr:olfactory receptor 6N1-like [Cololabis saira]
MVNSTQVVYFTLTAYVDIGLYKYLCFLMLLYLYVLIICANLLFIVVICGTRNLHEPMYMFLVSLFVNELYGSTGLFPMLLVQVLSDVHTVSFPLCFLQIFCVYSYIGTEVLILAVMSYDRYLAICFPLQYVTCMTPKKVVVLIALTWLIPLCAIVVLISLSVSLQLCGNVINKVCCGNYSIVKLACSDTTVNNIYGLIYTAISMVFPFILIIFTYVKILEVCFSGSKQAREKAISTCTPHLASIANFSFGVCFQILEGRLGFSRLSPVFDIFSSLYYLTCQPLLTPLIYGLKLSKIRDTCKRLLGGGKVLQIV